MYLNSCFNFFASFWMHSSIFFSYLSQFYFQSISRFSWHSVPFAYSFSYLNFLFFKLIDMLLKDIEKTGFSNKICIILISCSTSYQSRVTSHTLSVNSHYLLVRCYELLVTSYNVFSHSNIYQG